MEVMNNLKNFKKLLLERAELINSALDSYLTSHNAYPESIHKAVRYSLMAGGKRLRPAMVLESAAIFGLSSENVLPTACGIEMIHTYSLIHDDLPLMDNDDYRRGKPTCHKVFGEAIALLAGDALLTEGFALIAKNADIESISFTAVVDVIKKISESAGIRGMIGGQTVDIESTGRTIDKETLFYIDLHKTACLFKASLWSGARLAEASQDELALLDKFGEKIGLIFQITDDLLDLSGNEKLLGKPVGSDVKNKKNTFPLIMGFDNSIKLAKQLAIDAKDIISKHDKNGFFKSMIDFLINRQY
jgi:geranylgeranyl diphosphate synthase type II